MSKFKEKIKEIVKPAPKVEARISDEEALANKAILDANNSEKSKKDVMLKNTQELEQHLVFMQERINETSREFESKKRIVDSLNGSIAGAQTELQNLQSNFEKQNAKLLEQVKKQQSDIESADKTLRQLIADNEKTSTANKIEASRLAEFEQNCANQVYEMKKALTQNQSEWDKREKDILNREEALKEERVKFEEEKESLAPEAARISEIKNENILLLQKIEMDKIDIINLRRANESDRDRIQEERAAGKASLEREILALKNEDSRLRKWEQDLKDYDLEVRAKSAQADKILKRQQLEKEVSGK